MRFAPLVLPLLVAAMGALPACSPPPPETPDEVAAPRTTVRTRPQPRPEIDPEEGRDPLTPPSDVAGPIGGGRSATGVATKVLRAGTGKAHPLPTDRVRVVYTGWTRDGEMFDSSLKRGGSSVFKLDAVIPGWTEALQTMVEHEKRRVWIPAELAYGDTPKSKAAPAGQLTFDIELLEIIAPPETPADVATPPTGATVTSSGLAYVVLAPGTGKTSPGPDDTLEVDYSGWLKDGKMFDSSIERGEPIRIKPTQVIKGWTEVLQLMVEGEKVRVWIPGKLAYGDDAKGGRPAGQLTFDIQLLRINPP